MKRNLSKVLVGAAVVYASLFPCVAIANPANTPIAQEAPSRAMLRLQKSVTIHGYVVATVTYMWDDGYGRATGIQSKTLSCRGTASNASYVQCYIESGGKSIYVKVNYYRSDYGWKTGIGRILL